MKKIVLVMAVLMLATPAWATTAVEIKAVGGDELDEVEIWYDADGNLPRAFGLNITVTEGNIVDCVPFMEGECDDATRGYGILLLIHTTSGIHPPHWGIPK